MPLLLDDLKYNKLYNKNVFLPTNEDNRRKLASIVLLTPSYESSVRCMTYPKFINNRLYTSYYTEKDINFLINRESSSMILERDILQELDLIDNSLSKYNRVTIPVEDIGIRFPELNIPEYAMGTAYIFTDSSDRAYGCAIVNGNALTYLWSASYKIRMDLLDFVIDTVGVTAIAAHLDHDLLVKAKKEYHFIPARGKYLVRNTFKELNESSTLIESGSDYRKIRMDSKSVSKYKSSAKYLSHFRTEKDGSYDGYIWLDDDKVVAACSVDIDRGMIQAIEISKEYQGQGLSYDILKACVGLGGKTLTVAKNNTVAKHVYDKYGFKVSDTTDNQYKMVLEQSTVLTESVSLIDAEIKIWQAQIKITEEIIKFFDNASWVKSKLGSMKSKLIKIPVDGYNNSLVSIDDFKNQLENQKVTLNFYTNMKALDLKEQYDLSDMVKEYTYWIKALKCPKSLKVKILKRTISSYKATIKEYEKALRDYEKMSIMNRRKENLKALVSKTFSIFGFITGGPLSPLKSMVMKAILPKSNKKSILSDDELKAKIALYTKIVEALEEELRETQALNESMKLTTSIPKKIVDFNKELNSYPYAVILKNGRVEHDVDKIDFGKDYRTSTVAEFRKHKAGVCWDYVNYEADWFRRNGYSFETYYVQMDDKQDCPSHTFLVFRLPGSSKYYYFESSWKSNRGIYEVDSLEELFDFHCNYFLREYGNHPCYIWRYDVSKDLEHLNSIDYMNKMYDDTNLVYQKDRLVNEESLFVESSIEKNERLSEIDKDSKELAKSCDKFLKSVQNNPEYKAKFRSELNKIINKYKRDADKYRNASNDVIAKEVFDIEYNPRLYSEVDIDKYDINKGIVKVQITIDCNGSQDTCDIVGLTYGKDALAHIKKNNSDIFKNKYLKSVELRDDDGHWWIELVYDWSEDLKFDPFKAFRKPIKPSTESTVITEANSDKPPITLKEIKNDMNELKRLMQKDLTKLQNDTDFKKKVRKAVDSEINNIKEDDDDLSSKEIMSKYDLTYNPKLNVYYDDIELDEKHSAAVYCFLADADMDQAMSETIGDLIAPTMIKTIKEGAGKSIYDKGYIKEIKADDNNFRPWVYLTLNWSVKEEKKSFLDRFKVSKESTVITESVPVIPLKEDFVINETSIRSKEYMTIFEASLTEDAKYNTMIRKMIYPERIRNQKELLYQYDRIKEDCPFISRTFLDYERYTGYNLFIDMSYYMTNFIKHNYLKLDKSINITIDFINRFLEDNRLDALGYKKKTVFIPIHDWNVKEGSFLWDYKSNINPISIIYRMIKRGNDFQMLKDTWGKTDFVFLGDTGYFKINLSNFGAKDLPRFMANIKSLTTHERIVDSDEPDHSTKGLVASIADKLELDSHNKIEINNLVGSAAGDTLTPEEIKDKISSSSSDVAAKTDSKEEKRQKKEEEVVDGIKAIASKADSEDTIENELDNNEYLKQAIVDLQSMSPEAVDITPTRAARITELNNKFMENQIKGKKVSELIGDYQNNPLPEVALPIDSINDEWKHMTYLSFNNNYDVDSDISKCIYHFGQCTVPVSVRDIKVEDSSTSEDSIETWTVQCEDAYGKRFTLKFDIPKIIDKRFMKLRGNKKTMTGQLMNLPIIKTDRDTCQITSNYNKIFVRRFNTSPGKSNAVAGRFIKTVLKLKESGSKDYDIKLGDTTLISNKYDLPMDYIDIGSKIAKITYTNSSKVKITLYFDQDEFLSLYKDKLDPKKGDFAFVVAHYKDGKEDIIYPDATYSTIAEFATNMLWDSNQEFAKVYETTTQPIKSTYARASIMSTDIPVAVLLGYAIGLTAMLKRAAIEYTIEDDKRPRYDKNSYDCIRLADCWIIYKNTYLASMLLNGLKECDMASYTLTETNTRKMWLEQLDLYGGRIKADGLDVFYDLMFDPITKEVCARYNLPDNYCDALIYASHLLSDIKFNAHSDLSGNRFRNNEIIAGYTYKVLATAYSTYRRELKVGRQATMSVKRSAVIDSILIDNTCSDLSVLSPLLEVESANSVSFKGLSGMNTDRAYGLDKRIYSESMRNVLAMSTGFSSNVGINRQATIDMNIDTPRGYIKSSSVDDMSITKTFCMTEALTPYGSTSDDTFRTAMTFIQTSKHEMRTEVSDPLLISNGADQAIIYMTSDTFSFKAKESGVVKEKTDEYMVIEYKSGKTEVIDLREQMMKNSDGGMWIPVELKTQYKEGSHFKYGDILAVDPSSYSNNIGPSDNYSYNIGTLVKFAILATDAGYEDACVHTEWLSKALSSKVVDQKQYIFPKSTNVYEMVKKGQPIQEGEPLIIFQNAFEEEDANNLIRMLTNADEKAISELGRIPIRSKVTGVIDDIKIYRCVEVDELSPSLKKIVTEYERETNKFNKVLEKYDPEKAKTADATYKLEPTGKLKNCEGSVMIEFYISYVDNFSAADKVVNYSALKGVSSKQIPAGKEPRSKYRPDEVVHYQQSDIGDMKRMVGSIFKTGALNKLLIETGRQACDIMGIKWKYLDEY